MARVVITAPNDLDTLPDLGSLLYLNGPIQGARDWQAEALAILDRVAPDLNVASPRAAVFSGSPERHLQWEQTCLEHAASNGAVLFWLANETQHRCGRPHAAQMRFELGEWAVKAQAGLVRLVVGIERGFPGAAYLHRRLTTSFPNIVVCRTLQQTCVAGAELARGGAPITVYPRSLQDMFVPNFGLKNNG